MLKCCLGLSRSGSKTITIFFFLNPAVLLPPAMHAFVMCFALTQTLVSASRSYISPRWNNPNCLEPGESTAASLSPAKSALILSAAAPSSPS